LAKSIKKNVAHYFNFTHLLHEKPCKSVENWFTGVLVIKRIFQKIGCTPYCCLRERMLAVFLQISPEKKPAKTVFAGF
jgi:hypothetical protein